MGRGQRSYNCTMIERCINEQFTADGYAVVPGIIGSDEIKEIARAVSQWRPLAPSQDSIGEEGLQFLKKVVLV